ncbi:ABC transporter ATP-binding protein [Burkholderia ubonensis]|uniref:ABC transporter ATP-binding protein n=1 Tax=Burkholderia ubonensis TaxID=101571 RepID=UPI000F576045|nr:ABC transporter ATP-binding protein [Burkholderia ubonensis]RQP27729.1 ABC transporter ATP-binding protein [Burkholderia ubonensis]RQP29745.1 ABC transporter ATP-binding protein [Burkholderia ubonensis]RQP31901.1 ABC transporter ATP-binding protein [Burkholderia ubonensis]RQP47844.1 ABC transporter ATP-binding protein [Burkholderia ubonensis]RQP50861.1 ABC transporter ATP-binding protein [Burkholderia ubonensis]
MNATDVVVKLAGVSRLYRQGATEVHALQQIDMEIRRGEFVVLVGPSGSGKTTLLNMIGGLDSPTTGRVWVEGTEIGGLGKRALSEIRLRRIGFVFQEFNLIPVLSALENVEFVMLLQGVPQAQRRARAYALLKDLGLAGLEHRRPQQLSGGQQQRVAVARAIAAEPAIVLPDEPTANLDSKAGAALMDMMKALNERHGVTFVFSTHDPMVVERARRVIRLRDGRIEADDRRQP